MNNQTILAGEYHDVIQSQIGRGHALDVQDIARPN
jgi:hypothetical protein